VNQKIEFDFKFFGSISDKEQRECNLIIAETKKVEARIIQRDRMLA